MLNKGEYYIIETQEYISRIKVVAITEKFYGYIHAFARTGYGNGNVEYLEKKELEERVVESLGKNPEYSDDELLVNVFSNSTAD